MSTIRIIYSDPPTFPATDNHPDAVRYEVTYGDVTFYADVIDGPPTQEEVDAIMTPPV